MKDVIHHRTAFQERVTYLRTGRVVIRKFETPDSVTPYDLIIVAEGNKGTAPVMYPIDREYTAKLGSDIGESNMLCA